MEKNKVDKVWAISLMIIGIIALVIGITSIIGSDIIPHWIRLIIAIVQIVVGVILIIATVMRIKISEK